MNSFLSAEELQQKVIETNPTQAEVLSSPVDIAEFCTLLKRSGSSQLVVVGGRPSMGALNFCLNIVMHSAIEFKTPTMIFSQEVSAERLWRRLVKENDSGLVDSSMGGCELYFDDTASLSPNTLRAKLNEHIAHEDQPLVLIDSLQAMRSDQFFENRAQELSAISTELARIVRELDIVLIVKTDLDRALEYRKDKRPLREDFQIAGSIDLDADLLVSLYRDEIYNPRSNAVGKTELKVHKSRFYFPVVYPCHFVSEGLRYA